VQGFVKVIPVLVQQAANYGKAIKENKMEGR
jgi:hypothetical protein